MKPADKKLLTPPRRGIWGVWPAASATEEYERIPLIALEMIAREHSGKTALLLGFQKGPVLDAHPSLLELGLENPLQMMETLQKALAAYTDLGKRGLLTTLNDETLRYLLYDAEETVAVLQTREVVGQVLTHTTRSSPPEQQARYQQYVRNLSQANVLWVPVSFPAQRTAADLNRFQSDLQVHAAYLREALKLRETNAPCAVAVVLTKLDAAFPDAEQAKAALSPEWLREHLARLLNVVENSKRVGLGAIFPVSAFGFGNAVAAGAVNGSTGHGDDEGAVLSHNEPEYILKKGSVPQPYNLTALVWWTLWAGLLHHEVEPGPDGEPELADAARRLQGDLKALDPWYLPLNCQG